MLRALALTLAAAAAAPAGVIYVDASAPANGDGQSWATAFDRLQDALAIAAAGDEVRTADGTYKPALPNGPREATYAIPSGVGVLGGYAGLGADDPDARDPSVFVTTLSGDLNGDDGDHFANINNNAYHVVSLIDADPSTLLDGVTVRNGAANLWGDDAQGGGVAIHGGAPEVRNCVVRGCYSQSGGGGLDNAGAAPSVIDCRFEGNSSWSGGGVGSRGGASGLFRGCVFSGNTATFGAGASSIESSPRFEECRFENGVVNQGGAGVVEDGSGSVYLSCVFANNRASGGGAAYCLGEKAPCTASFQRCLFAGNRGDADGGGAFFISYGTQVTAANCVFTGNRAAGGGAVFVNDFAVPGPQSLDLSNCTIVNNSGGGAAGGVYVNFNQPGSMTRVSNCIVWNNTNGMGGPPDQGGQVQAELPEQLSLEYCDIQGWDGTLNGEGCFGSDPLFRDLAGADGKNGTEDDDVRIGAGSPCTDAGNNLLVPADTLDLDADGDTAEPIPFDMAGAPRFIEDPATPDTGVSGNGHAEVVDIGAFEFAPPACYADFTADGVLDLFDFLAYVNAFNAADPSADCDGNGNLDLFDFLCYVNAFNHGCL